MKKRAMILLAALVMFISAFPACPAAAADVGDFPVFFTRVRKPGGGRFLDVCPAKRLRS